MSPGGHEALVRLGRTRYAGHARPRLGQSAAKTTNAEDEKTTSREYLAEPVACFMPGYWTTGVNVALDDEPAESVEFGSCAP